MTLKQAAACFSVSPATAHRWWHRWLEAGEVRRLVWARAWDPRRCPNRARSRIDLRDRPVGPVVDPDGVAAEGNRLGPHFRPSSPRRSCSSRDRSGRACSGGRSDPASADHCGRRASGRARPRPAATSAPRATIRSGGGHERRRRPATRARHGPPRPARRTSNTGRRAL
jgi:hypothetical protein